MVASMTSFARSVVQTPWGQAVWEIRSVNHRYLEVGFKIPEPLREGEMTWRQLATRHFQRGKIDCYLNFIASPDTQLLELNLPLVTQLLSHCEQLTKFSAVQPQVPALDLLRWPEVLKAPSKDNAGLQTLLTDLLGQAFEALKKGRAEEGAQLQQILQEKMQQSLKLVNSIKKSLVNSQVSQRKHLIEKFEELKLKIDPQRLEQEFAILIQRADITEEIDRLLTHLEALRENLNLQVPIGRRLDFLMQEMNREANTLGAKAVDISIIQMAIELKVLIEQMREQIQNVE